MTNTWIQTYSGAAFDYLSPSPDAIHEDDLAYGLARCGRYARQTRHHYSVAQHSVIVAEITAGLAPDNAAAQLWAVLHDAHEAYTGDIPTPLMNAIRFFSAGRPHPITMIQAVIDEAILRKFEIDPADVRAVSQIVKQADAIALSTERARGILNHRMEWAIDLPEPAPIGVVPISAAASVFVWRSALHKSLAAYRASKMRGVNAAE